MKDNSIAKLGSACAILVGISYIVVGGNYLLMPAEQRAVGDLAQFLESFAQNPMPSTIQYWAFALGAVLALAVVLAISESVRSVNEGWERWTSNLAFLGFAVLAINNFRFIGLQPERATAYMAGDAATKAAIEVSGPFSLDPQAWLGFGAVGLWVLVVSLLALRGDIWPKPLVYVGIATTIAYWLVVAGYVLSIEPLVAIAAGLGGVILAPIWYIWIGLRLRRKN
jgi:hypothetical protein